jgi:PAS domain S-box-containing protein
MTNDLGTPGIAPLAQRLLDTSPDALLTITEDGRVLSWNRGAEPMFGYTAEEAIGRRIVDLTVPDELRREASIRLRQGVEGGSPAQGRRADSRPGGAASSRRRTGDRRLRE